MQEALNKHGMFNECEPNCGLWNIFRDQKATSEQAHDLLNFREIGQLGFENSVKTRILKQASTVTFKRKKRLCTFHVSKTEKRRIKQVEKESKLTQRFLKCHLARLLTHPGEVTANPELCCGPISPIPRAIVASNGLPYKATKSTVTGYLEKRYNGVPVVLQALPVNWIPECVILEGMFMIQTPPLPNMHCMELYVKLLIQKFVRPHLYAGATEIHVVFDNPGSLPETPKEVEHIRRDQGKTVEDNHECVTFESASPTPKKWRSIIGCRKCKKCLTAYIASEMLTLCPFYLKGSQSFVSNIGTKAYRVTPFMGQRMHSSCTQYGRM